MKRKSKILILVEFLAAFPIIIIFRILPTKLAYKFGHIISTIIFVCDRRHRNRVIDHLLFSGACANKEEALVVARKHADHIGDLLAEIVKMNQLITPANISNHVSFAGSQKSIDMFFDTEHPRNAIVLTAHYGNWEVAAKIYTLQANKHLLSVARPIDNPLIGRFLSNQRETFNNSICPKDGAMKKFIKALRKGDSISMVIDQHAGRGEGIETDFFGKAVRTHISPALLHLKTGVPILVGITRRVGEFQFKVFVSDPIIMESTKDKEADIKKLTQAYTSALEKLIRENGIEQWMWAHRRWLDLRTKTVRESDIKE